MATKLYDAGKYSKAIRILSKLLQPIEVSLKQKNCFICSQSYYKTKQYTLAGYQFESFVSYPKVKT
jgi:outer membrane protein assembly factor BamD